LYQAVLTARRSAFEVIRPGVEASEVDRAAREAIGRYGVDKEFKHATGHGVGFAAINHLARPRLHPCSEDVLQVGMVFNVEPAAYIAGYGGLRHCDMVVVTQQGMELLTPFHTEARELVLETR